MQNVFYSLRDLDKLAEETFSLGNGLLMENAARGTFEKLKFLIFQQRIIEHANCANKKFINSSIKKPRLQIICGSGDNGGDGLALARMSADLFDITVVCIKEPKSELCKLQKKRLEALGIKTKKSIDSNCDILFDAFLGTGLRGSLKKEDSKLIQKMNDVDALKIACDIPSGLNEQGLPAPVAFKADFTFSMGSLKTAFFSDFAKDFVGKIEVIDLGIPRSKYERRIQNNTTDKTQSCLPVFLLEKTDMQLPTRKLQNTHKGLFGHVAVIAGEKYGACMLASKAALKFGAGLVTICGENINTVPDDFMHRDSLFDKVDQIGLSGKLQNLWFNTLSIGSGLGRGSVANNIVSAILKNTVVQNIPIVLDADVFYYPELKDILPKLKSAVLTPHPKEFLVLLKNYVDSDFNTDITNLTIDDIQQNRFELLDKFSKTYPQLTLLLKGANTLIASGGKIFINALGSSALSKAGTGDVLTGMIASLLAQGYQPVQAATTASIAHSVAANYFDASYSLTASELIANIEKLEYL